ncbi:ABC transporter ATP-binding protein [Candidimonas sp. SYP-B2681]|uniref:ABC transporter ATP-binding protein n=1 Tax=Candidimonas sp. SYP-B2681 TaxID=2497686 RepID=UPI000F892A42|nr:ABC transporter ATP-binding protein [Candidimonas sp. SYP-B2681]RTZ44419.1 ABC transporter ATP-binding protein [Candidimonas sp. SYP-B2681]
MSAIELRNISKNFGDTQVIFPTDLTVEHGELVTLLGPSGSGKSTVLSMIAGLLTPSSGQILIGGKDITHVPSARRNLGMVFQSYALFPHMTVFDNVAFPLTIRKFSKAQIEKKVKRVLDMVRLEGLEKRKQTELSGGQQQRVALARALVFEPDILLLDEPLGALDKKLREEVQLELRQLQRNLGVTTIMVTHDQEEALSLSTRLVVLDAGRVQQVGTPEQAYKKPVNKFVAEFLGTANLWRGNAHEVNEAPYISLPSGERLPCPPNSTYQGGAHLLVRPEDLRINEPDPVHGLPATVTETVYLGQSTRMHLETASGLPVVAMLNGMQAFSEGQSVMLTWAPENTWVIPA